MQTERKPSLGKLNSRTTWSGSTLNTNYRASTWPTLGPPKRNSGKQMKEATVENDQTVANQTHISAPPHADAVVLLENALILTPPMSIHLWSLSLVGSTTKMNPQTLEPLSHIACLGFLDLSETDVSLQTIQTSLRQIQIMRLHLFHCPNILSVLKGAQSSFQEASFSSSTTAIDLGTANMVAASDLLQITGIAADTSNAAQITQDDLRGFMVYALPNVWTLDGIPILHQERRKWSKHFAEGGKGQFSDLIRKHYIEDAAFVARKKKQYAQPSYIKAEYIYESPIQKKLWSSRAKKVIGDMPTEFNMPIDQDLWRLKRLAADLERRVIQTFPPSVFSLEKIRGSVACFVGVPNQYSPLQNNAKFATAYNVDSQISLALLILSSLIDEFPVHLAQSALEHIFEANEENGKRKQHWAQRPISPLLWRVQERLEYLGLLIASIEMSQAINPNPNSTAKTSPEVAQLLLLTANPNNRPEILSRLEPFRQIHLMMHEVLYSMKLDTAFTHFSFTDFEPLPSMYPPPTLKHHTTTTPLLSNTTLLSYIRTTPNLSQHYHPKHSTTLISHALVQLEVIPFLVCKSANVPAVEFLELFPGVQRVLEHVAGMALRLCVQRGDCPASIGGGVLEKRMRSKSRSRSRSAVRRSMGSAGESFGIYEKVLKISMEGVMSAREIQVWTSSEDKFGQVAKAEKGNGSGDEGDEDEEDEPIDEFASSLDGLVFQIKLRILEAVDDIIRIVYGEVEEPVYRFAPPPKTPEPIYRKADSPEPQQVVGAEEHNDNEEDEEMRMFDLLRHLRIAKHHRDPVPSSLVMKGKKI